MTEKNTPLPSGLIAGICFGLAALLSFFSLDAQFSIWNLLFFLCYGLTAVVLCVKELPQKALLTTGGFAGLALLQVIVLFANFSKNSGLYRVWDYSYYSGFSTSFNLLCLLPMVLVVAAYAAMLLVAVVTLHEEIPQLAGKLPEEKLAQSKDLFKKLWFIPGTALGASMVLALLVFLISMLGLIGSWYAYTGYINLTAILSTVGMIFAAMHLVYPEGMPKQEGAAGNQNYGDGYCGLVKHALLLVFTFGIWQYIWIYRTTRYLNRVTEEDYRDPTKKLLLCMFVPMYMMYWVYKSAQRIDILAEGVGNRSNLTGLCTILAVISGFFPLILMQEKINVVIQKEAKAAAAAAAESVAV